MTATVRTARASRRRAPRQRIVRRRRTAVALGAALIAACAALLLIPHFDHAVREIRLPLRHDDIIRQQARDKQLDPALIAAVIYAESRFIDDRTSSAGAKGLMQLTPATATMIAHRSGGTAFRLEDLGTPQVNISYGAWYLRYLLRRYGGNEAFALAAYNGGEGNVDRWLGEARAREEALTIDAIPFAETRHYVARVQDARDRYRAQYPRELRV